MNKKTVVVILLILAFLVALHQFIYWRTWFSVDDLHHETFIVALSCLALGIILSEKLEDVRRTRKKEPEYRRQLMKHLPNLIKPLLKLLGELWVNLIGLIDWETGSSNIVKGHELENNLGEVVEAINNLRKFVEENETQIDLILPHSLQSWQYSRIQSFVRRFIEDIEYGEAKADDIHGILGAIMDIQHNLQKIVAVRAFAH